MSLPISLTNHRRIEVILLDSNLFSEFPSLLSSLPSLRIVTLEDNIIGNIGKSGNEKRSIMVMHGKLQSFVHFIFYLQKKDQKQWEDKHEKSVIKNNYMNKHHMIQSRGEQQQIINKSVMERINEWENLEEQDVGHEPSPSTASCSRCIQPTNINISFKDDNSCMEIVIEPNIDTIESTRKANKTADD